MEAVPPVTLSAISLILTPHLPTSSPTRGEEEHNRTKSPSTLGERGWGEGALNSIYDRIPMHDDSNARRGSFGCWLAGLGALVLVAVLVIAGLFLPPFDLYNRLRGEPYATLHNKGDSLTSTDKVVRVTAADTEAN